MSVGFLIMLWCLMFCAPDESACTSSAMVIHPEQVQAEPKIGTYGFVHHETTGITTSVIVNSIERRIKFHPDSDPIAIKSLMALTWKVLLPNCDGKKLFLVGQYFTASKRTSKCDRCPGVEEYREFKLLDWYIITPFKAVRDDCDDCAYLREENLRTRRHLKLEDFRDFEGRESINVSRFQRAKATLPRRR